MYHPAKKFTITALSALFASAPSLAFPSFASANGTGTVAPVGQTAPLEGKVGVARQRFGQPPTGGALRKRPAHVKLYEYDKIPLGNRQPFLFVHGLRGEYYPTFRWDKVARAFIADPAFNKTYKIYLLRYATTVPLATTVPQFREAVKLLSDECEQRPITIVALSMGGNLVREGMIDKDAGNAIRFVMTLGTPFHGSPLFSRNWVQYSIYKNFAMPWTRVDHSIAFRLYFHHNPNLQKDLPWDNVDKAIPEVGRYYSFLPLGPHGNLTPENSGNKYLASINEEQFDKKKFVTYSGYLLNPYMRSEPMRIAETTLLAPYTVLSMKIPAHFAREHAVLKMLNCVIGSVVSSKDAVSEAKTPFLYQLNDGITPVNSALFLPNDAFKKSGISSESSLVALKDLTDVRVARVFRNIDHLTFIDGIRPAHGSALMRDELRPESSAKKMFDWMLADILSTPENVGTKMPGAVKPNVESSNGGTAQPTADQSHAAVSKVDTTVTEADTSDTSVPKVETTNSKADTTASKVDQNAPSPSSLDQEKLKAAAATTTCP